MNNLDTSENNSVAAPLIRLLDEIVASTGEITFSTRALVVEERITPALTALRGLKNGDFPELVMKGETVMSDWARMIVASPTGWWIYADRLQRQARSLRLVLQVRSMGKLSKPL